LNDFFRNFLFLALVIDVGDERRPLCVTYARRRLAMSYESSNWQSRAAAAAAEMTQLLRGVSLVRAKSGLFPRAKSHLRGAVGSYRTGARDPRTGPPAECRRLIRRRCVRPARSCRTDGRRRSVSKHTVMNRKITFCALRDATVACCHLEAARRRRR